MEQVKNYIENYLSKCTTFNLKKGDKITTKTEEDSKFYFYELDKSNENNIYHLIYANEGSEAGKYYNKFTLDFIENSYQSITSLKTFDVIDSIKERFIEFSNDIIEQAENEPKITKESFDDSIPNIIKLKYKNKIIFKKFLIDDSIIPNFKINENYYEPKYDILKKDDKIIVKVEVPGNFVINSQIDISGEFNIIKISWMKKKDKETEGVGDIIYNSRVFGEFNFVISLRVKEYPLKKEAPSIRFKNGICILEYYLDKISEK